MVDLEDLIHSGAEVRDFDVGWGAYFQVHAWDMAWKSDLMWMIDMRHFEVMELRW